MINPIMIPIGSLSKNEFIDAMTIAFIGIESELSAKIYDETHEHFNSIIYDLNTGEMIHTHGVMGWNMSAKYMANIPTHENIGSLENTFRENPFVEDYGSKKHREEEKTKKTLESFDIGDIFDKIAKLGGDIKLLSELEKEWLDRYNSQK